MSVKHEQGEDAIEQSSKYSEPSFTNKLIRRKASTSLKNGLMTRKGQGAIIDFLVAFFIFLTIFLVNHYTWNSVEVKIVNTEDDYYFETSVYQAVEDLIKNKGEPSNWHENTSSVASIGLAEEENTLSNEKLIALNNTSYNLLRDFILSTGDYEITIKNKTGIIYQTGVSPAGSITRVERLVIINNSYYKFVFKGWVE